MACARLFLNGGNRQRSGAHVAAEAIAARWVLEDLDRAHPRTRARSRRERRSGSAQPVAASAASSARRIAGTCGILMPCRSVSSTPTAAAPPGFRAYMQALGPKAAPSAAHAG